MKSIRLLRKALINLEGGQLFGGWEETFEKNIEETDGKLYMKGFELRTDNGRTRQRTDFSSTRSSIIESILDLLSKRFESDDELVNVIEPFIKMSENVDLRKIHQQFASDFDLTSLQLQYNELVDQRLSTSGVDEIIKKLVKNPATFNSYKELVTTFARIQITQERSISANNNRLKTPLRNQIKLETEIKNLYVHFNMPPLEKWNPRHAMKLWMNDNRRNDYSNVIERKATHASHFKGIFNASHEEKDSSGVEKYVENFFSAIIQ